MTFQVIEGGLSGPKIAELLEQYQFNYGDEKDLQEAIETIFTEEKIAFRREAQLSSGGRIDFLIGKLGVEIKVGHSYADVIFQLHAYAKCAEIEELVLVTTRLTHQMPPHINNKRLTTVNMGYTNSL
jgi:hypothetical protein